MSGRCTAAAIALLAAVALICGAGTARANGVAQIVKLSYLDGVSSWGPKDAEGVLQFSLAEAYARVEVKHLAPIAGFTYEGWLVAPGGQTFAVGIIPVSADGVGTLEAKLAGLDRYDYSLFVVAGRAADSHDAKAVPAQKSIAGRFTVLAEGKSSELPADVRPASLPDTGEAAPGKPWGRILATGGTMAGTALILIGVKRRQLRKEHRA